MKCNFDTNEIIEDTIELKEKKVALSGCLVSNTLSSYFKVGETSNKIRHIKLSVDGKNRERLLAYMVTEV